MMRLFITTCAFLFLVAACDSAARPIPRMDKDTAATADEDEITITDDLYPDGVQTDDNIPDDPAADDPIADNPVNDETADDPLPDESADTPIPDDMTDTVATDDMIDDPVTDDPITDTPITDDTTDTVMTDDITDTPIPDDTTDTPVPDDTTDTVMTDDTTDTVIITDDTTDTTIPDDTTDTTVPDDTIDDPIIPDTDATGDTTPPTILGTLPQDEATGIAADTTIEIQFSEPLDQATLTDAFELTLNTVPATTTFVWRSDDNTVVLTPDATLTPGATYILTVTTAITDAAGNHLAVEYSFEFTVALCGNGIPESGEQCDLGVSNGNCSVCTAACTTKPANICGDTFICGAEQCETGQTLTCATALSDANAVGTAPCNGACSGYTTASNCTKTYSCPTKPVNTDWNTVSSYTQTWNGSAWTPATDATTEYNTAASTESCRYKCTTGYVWNGVTQLCVVAGCGNGVTEIGEECDDNNAVNTDACKNDCTDNTCGDDVIYTGVETCDGTGTTCAAALSDANAVGTAPCNDECTGYLSASNCTKTYSCPAKPANTDWNTVSNYTQTWNGTAWTPTADATTEYNTAASTESCRYKCTTGYVWNDIQCVVKPANCGNGTPDAGEQCDDGNTVNADACKNDCTFNTCGDGVAGGSLPTLIYTFENGGSMPTNGVTNGTTYGWVISTTQKHAGTYSARSATMGNNATATITFTGLSDGEICYWRAGSSESGYDYFTVTIDGASKESLSGTHETWTRICWAVTPGINHTVVFRYAKDEGVAEGWDRWYIDDLTFSDGGTEQCDDGNAVNTDACKNNCTNNTCGDGVVYTGVETCDTTGMACATLLSIPAAIGTAPCNAECTGYTPIGNCTKTNTCPAKPATGTVWNTVSSYTQSWTGSAWNPVDDTTTTYNATGSTTECRYTCAFNWTWDGTACVTTDFLAETIAQISEQNMTDTVTYLASATCDGRNNNTTGSTNARTYLIDELTAAGVEAGGAGGAWTQSFSNYWCNSGLRTGTNVVGYIEGSDPTLKNEFVVIGAHYDHLGHTGATYYPGADDNASGTAMMVEVAAALKRIQSHLARSVILIGFDAEEDGLCGSNYYNDNPLFPLNDTVYMIDLDMVGYLRSNAVELTDSNGSTWGNAMLSTLADKYGLTESFESCGYDCSDHAPFYDSGIPSLMITTGLEDVYHKTTDTANLVSYDGMVTLTGYVTEFAYEVNVHTDPFLYFAPFEAPQIWQPREFRDHGVLPANTPRD